MRPDPSEASQLCGNCKSITFTMLLEGFVHSRTFSEAVASGRTCKLCRLMVCMYSKLQKQSPWSPYAVDRDYDAMAQTLPYLPAVHRKVIGTEGLPYFETLAKPTGSLSWNRHEYTTDFMGEKPVLRHGNFGNSSTIQVSASEGKFTRDIKTIPDIRLDSYYYLLGLAPLRKVTTSNSPQNYGRLRSWLGRCMKTHKKCSLSAHKPSSNMSYETAVLPTRVIDVGSDGPPHLVEPEGKRGRYITLSHRWGKHAKIETKTCNIARFKQALPMDELPQTFKDVIIVTRELGFQYIWIDSLCIVQNDTEDWVRESEQMGDIFESSSCTIAAVHALDENSNDCGLFIPRNDPLAIDICCPISKEALPELSAKILNSNGKICVWKYKWLGGGLGAANITDIISRNTIVLRPRITSLWHKMRQSEWYNRGWVFQERILARRIIYYAHDKLYWDCFEEQGDEQGAETKSPTRTAWFSPDGMKASAPQSFRNLLAREYSTSILSKREDKLNAITGICNKFRDYGGNNFYAGILDDATGESLLWYASEAAMLLYDDFHAPSWTWVNRSGQPSYYLPEPLDARRKVLTSNLSFRTRDGCNLKNPYGRCQGTCISGTCSLTAPTGKLLRGSKLFDLKFNGYDGPAEIASNELLIWILGSGVHWCGISIPRLDIETENVTYSPRNLFLPRHTELLFDPCGFIIGYLVPDESRSSTKLISVVCSGVCLWEHEGPLREEPLRGRVRGYGYDHERCIDVIALEEVANDPTIYQRVGRGRIVCNGWLAQCSTMTVTIV